ncbi:restriction endonuclease subunit S [Pseudaquabacterium pictum]|uniref:Type I restriction enzyme EcoEI specificity protein n=1 Tax=Pseudaquabacterium pictum TaxID=2315236 RepID=A0A480AW41_9BURK|nr:restriction endonuclease subunit S [Rubrivivax pictus]GCL65543.1 type I restriction enzyme EcoEI specificity protein [Rubrivivax pictus]
MSELPKGWAWATVGDLAEYINGFAFKPTDRSESGLPIIRIQNLTDPERPLHLTQRQVPDEYRVRTGDILVSWSATLDAFRWGRGEALVNQHIFKVVPNSAVAHAPWLLHWLRVAIAQMQDTEHLHGSTMKHINRGPFLAHRVPVPPPKEQLRIANALEDLLSELDAGVEELKTAQAKLQRYRQSMLKAAVQGDLTADWRAANPPAETGAELLQRILAERRARWEGAQRDKAEASGKALPPGWQAKYAAPAPALKGGQQQLPVGWIWATTEMTGDVLLGRQRAPQYLTGRWTQRYLRVANIKDNRIDFSDVESMDFDDAHFAKYRLVEGDILVSEGQSPELVGQSAIFRGYAEPLCFQKTLHRYRASPGVALPEYAQLVFRANVCTGVFRSLASITTNIAHLTLEKFEAAPFPLPPLAEQEVIVAVANAHLQVAGELDRAIATALRQSAAQRQNILRAAFAGQLVPQDPADEPAQAVLARIRASRAEAKPPARKRAAAARAVAQG